MTRFAISNQMRGLREQSNRLHARKREAGFEQVSIDSVALPSWILVRPLLVTVEDITASDSILHLDRRCVGRAPRHSLSHP